MDEAIIRKRIYRYCAYQERSHSEVRTKLLALGARGNQLEELLSHLVTENYVSEERFARAYAGGKFRMKKWGRLKIMRGLRRKGLTMNCMQLGLSEIDERDYQRTLREMIRDRQAAMIESDPYKLRAKLSAYAIRKGFEPELVNNVVRLLVEGD